MAEETIQILKVDTLQPIKSIGELRERIKNLKDSLQDMTIGSEEYAKTLTELTGYQTALKNAMHATTGSAEDQTQIPLHQNVPGLHIPLGRQFQIAPLLPLTQGFGKTPGVQLQRIQQTAQHQPCRGDHWQHLR